MAPTGLISPQEYFFPEIGSICTTGIFIRCGFRYRSSNLLHKGQNHPSPQIPHAHKTLNQYCRWMQRNTSDWKGNGYNYEAEEVMLYIGGQTESQLLPLSFSLQLMKLLQTILELAKCLQQKKIAVFRAFIKQSEECRGLGDFNW